MVEVPRHTLVVRITHWMNTIAFLALLVSGSAILLAHPRLYWGETGAFGGPAFIELPLPLNLDQSGWGRSLHFLAAWICVLNGTVYLLSGFAKMGMSGSLTSPFFGPEYNIGQKSTYLAVVFVLGPLMILTGLAMSPAVMAAIPFVVEMFGGHQSARTIHFFVTNALVLFLVVHVTMVWLAGFKSRMRGMITGRI